MGDVEFYFDRRHDRTSRPVRAAVLRTLVSKNVGPTRVLRSVQIRVSVQHGYRRIEAVGTHCWCDRFRRSRPSRTTPGPTGARRVPPTRERTSWSDWLGAITTGRWPSPGVVYGSLVDRLEENGRSRLRERATRSRDDCGLTGDERIAKRLAGHCERTACSVTPESGAWTAVATGRPEAGR